ncbi:MAG: PAS domain-containing protein [Deltaproteobacteria bacterium]|jgi:two-component system phosphate regulon sensor histidine kinase PhoR|nr:PAS domain-containing protein [Deltaproteobacteria bacterium]
MINNYKIFALIFLPAALVLVFGLALIQQKNVELSSRQFEDQLKNQWQLVSIIQASTMDTEVFKDLSKKLGLRVTLIDRIGTVLFDTGTQGEVTEDHSQREEIRSAFLGVPAMATRQSATTGLYTIYYADRINDDLVLRVAYPADYYQNLSGALLAQTFSGLLALVIGVGIFAFLVSKNTSKTLKELSQAVNDAKNGNQNLPTFNNASLDTVLYSLSTVTRELKEFGQKNATLNSRLQYILDNIKEGVILIENDSIIYSNEKTELILGYKLPGHVSEINQTDMLSIMESLTGKEHVSELHLGDRTISVNYQSSEQATLIILHDISDRLKYSGYKSDLVANISHELKTPLTLIMTTSEVITKDKDMSKDNLDKFLTTIYGNARRLNTLLDDLISLHRFETSEPLLSSADLDEVVTDVRDLIETKGKTLNWQTDSGQVNVNGSHLTSVLVNLIGNAIKYSSGSDIDIGLKRSDHELEITVADQGPVIPLNERERIFERFYSLSASRNRDNSGSGLGLSIVKHIAKLYGGQAKVVENDKPGNTFVVRLTQKDLEPKQ